jgi:hypothetical protein
MATLEIEVEEGELRVFENNRESISKAIRAVLREYTVEDRVEQVKILTRLRTPVVNWNDLEAQILLGALGAEAK